MYRLSLALLSSLTLLFLACAGVNHPATAPTATRPKQYTRAEFDQAVVGKTVPEVVQLLGAPESTDRGGRGIDADNPQFDGSMRYINEQVRVRDPISGNTSDFLRLYFRDGKVRRVDYW